MCKITPELVKAVQKKYPKADQTALKDLPKAIEVSITKYDADRGYFEMVLAEKCAFGIWSEDTYDACQELFDAQWGERNEDDFDPLSDMDFM